MEQKSSDTLPEDQGDMAEVDPHSMLE